MDILILIALCALIYLVYLMKQEYSDARILQEAQMQRLVETVIKSQENKE